MLNKLFSLFFIFIACISQSIAAPSLSEDANTVQTFIEAQQTIRVIADDAPGFGDQAASYNVVRWLRDQRHYTGTIEFIYNGNQSRWGGYTTKDKIIALFNLPTDMPDNYFDSNLNIRFIQRDQFLVLSIKQALPEVTLGINGGGSDHLCEQPSHNTTGELVSLSAIECHNKANFYNTALFIELNPSPTSSRHNTIGYVHLRDQLEVGENADDVIYSADQPPGIGKIFLKANEDGSIQYRVLSLENKMLTGILDQQLVLKTLSEDALPLYNSILDEINSKSSGDFLGIIVTMLQNQLRHPINIYNTYVPVPKVDDILTAKKHIENDTTLINKFPALPYFIDGLINQDFDMMAVYGYPVKKAGLFDDYDTSYIGNILQIITAARYAQQHNPQNKKPLIIAVFYNYDEELTILNDIIRNNNWTASTNVNYPIDTMSQANIIKAINDLKLKEVFAVSSLNQPEAISLFQQLKIKSDDLPKIIVLSMSGALPKSIFDAIYTYTGNNIWPQIREGDTSFNSLILTGKPHFRCVMRQHMSWEPGYDLITDPLLKTRLDNLYDNQNGFCQGFNTWKDNPLLYQKAGELMLEAANPDSSLSRYFQLLKEEASNPKNDRILRALDYSLSLLNPTVP